jgi:hypothetical protein
MKKLLAVATLALALLAGPALAHDHASHEVHAQTEAAKTVTESKSHKDCAHKTEDGRKKLTIAGKGDKLVAKKVAKHDCCKDKACDKHESSAEAGHDCCGEGKGCCEHSKTSGVEGKDCCAGKSECGTQAKKSVASTDAGSGLGKLLSR